MFTATTTYRDGAPPITKPFTWSYSRLKNFRACPHKHWQVDILKTFKEEEGEALKYGNAVHDAMAKRVEKGIELPPTMREFEEEAAKLTSHLPPGVILMVEQNMAITRNFTSCGYFAPDVWYRAKCDVVKIAGAAGAAVDWKTGKINEDSEQLALMAQCVFSKFPQVQVVRTKYVWLGSYAETVCDFTRADMPKLWNHLWPELGVYEQAWTNQMFPPKPGGLCKRYCPVTSCQYHGKGSRP